MPPVLLQDRECRFPLSSRSSSISISIISSNISTHCKIEDLSHFKRTLSPAAAEGGAAVGAAAAAVAAAVVVAAAAAAAAAVDDVVVEVVVVAVVVVVVGYL